MLLKARLQGFIGWVKSQDYIFARILWHVEEGCGIGLLVNSRGPLWREKLLFL